jgi:hypothetical protein
MMAWMDDDAAAQNCAGEEGLLVWCDRGGTGTSATSTRTEPQAIRSQQEQRLHQSLEPVWLDLVGWWGLEGARPLHST